MSSLGRGLTAEDQDVGGAVNLRDEQLIGLHFSLSSSSSPSPSTCTMLIATQQEPVQISPAIHALGLPEIALRVSLYLDVATILACHSASRALRLSFEPFVWQDIHFGPPRHLDYRKRPPARTFNSQNITYEIMDASRRAAPWIKSLSIFSHDSIFPLQLGELCFRLERMDLEGLRYDVFRKDPPEYWTNCERMIQQNQSRLRSLSLTRWSCIWTSKNGPKRPAWNPLVTAADCSTLRSLTLKCCEVRGRYMSHFWKVCQQLESLELDGVQLEMPPRSSTATATTASTLDTSIIAAPAPVARFPRLQELIIQNMTYFQSSRRILNLMVAQCPVLETLYWSLYEKRMFPYRDFTNLFCDSTWPRLDSITIKDHWNTVDNELYYKLLTNSHHHQYHRPLRRLCVNRTIKLGAELALFSGYHFHTLEKIDIFFIQRTDDWTARIMTSCPSLQRFKSRHITAQNIIDSGPSWVCHGLQKLSIMIDMGFAGGPFRKFTEKDMEQCRAVFKQLASLRKLRILDMLMLKRRDQISPHSPLNNPIYYQSTLVPLPMRLKAGMDQLGQLTELEKVAFWSGRQATFKKEVIWMLDHWRRLKKLQGSWLTTDGKSHEGFYNGELQQLLAQRGVCTYGSGVVVGSHFGESGSDRVEDCCGECE